MLNPIEPPNSKPSESPLPERVAPADSVSVSTKVRDTWLGRFYFNHLKKYRFVKWLAPWLWRKIYLLYRLNWIYGKAQKRPIRPLATYARQNGASILSKSETVLTPRPAVFPSSREKVLVAPHTQYQFPEIYTTEVRNAVVSGGTNFVLADESVICHDLYDFARDYTSEELNWRTYIWPHRQRIAWLANTVGTKKFDRAACFTDACASNYAHWMTEVLPRINLFCRSEQSPAIPLLVNDGLHENLMQSLRLVAGGAHEIVTLPIGACAEVEHLVVTSAAGYVPFERRTKRAKNHSHGRFSPSALLALRQRLQQKLDSTPASAGPRIFIKRNSGIRHLTNSAEIEALLVARGFTVIEPEHLTITEQIATFSEAEVVVGATGAAMANLIFCKPTAKIIIMIPVYHHTSYWYWQNIACAVGNHISYVLGDISKGNASGIHSDFHVKASDLLDAIGAAK